MSNASRRAIVILGHGSRRPEGLTAIIETAERYQARHPKIPVRHAFMEFAEPHLVQCIESLVAEDVADEIFVVPLFLALGTHCAKHMPEELALLSKRFPDKRLLLARPFGADPLLCDIIDARVRELEIG